MKKLEKTKAISFETAFKKTRKKVLISSFP